MKPAKATKPVKAGVKTATQGTDEPHPAKLNTPPAPTMAQLTQDPGADKKHLQKLAAAAHPGPARETLLDAEHNVPAGDSAQHYEPDERRRITVERLGAAWRDAHDRGDAEGADHVAGVLPQFGAKLEGPRPGEPTAFNGRLHDSTHSVLSGPVTVLRQPVVLHYPDGSQHVATKGKVGPVAAARTTFAPPASPEPGHVYQVDPKQIMVDPARFQFKLGTDPTTGTGKELTHVGKFDPELGGVLAVWRDPADGKTNVVNGHHRLDLAKRAGQSDVSVRYLQAKTAEEARAKGALINIAEGRGTAVDAAKFLRDTGRSAEDLAQVGVSLKGAVAKDAVDLAKLSPTLFRRVAFGAVEPERGVAVARHLPAHHEQEQLVAAVEKREASSGRPVSPKVVEAMAQEMRDAPKLTRTTEGLFGPIEDEDSTYFHRAELKSFIRGELAKEARDFRLGASNRRADALKAVAGNTLDTSANKTVADKADAALATFDGQARLKGPLSDLLNNYAVEYANASTTGRTALRTKALAAVREHLSGREPAAAPKLGGGSPGLFE